MPLVELVSLEGCPHRETARAHLRAALREAGLPIHWNELDAGCPEQLPEHARGWASPTILVGGRDVCGEARAAEGSACRVYRSTAGLSGAPSVSAILAALRAEAGMRGAPGPAA